MPRRILCFLTCLLLALAPGCDGKPGVKRLRVLAAEGDVEAQYQLGLRYATGDGIPVDVATAVGWYRRAAAQGHSEAQVAFARALAEGAGVPKDIAAALHWYREAAAQGQRPAQLALGTILLRGTEVPADPVSALAWLKIAGATMADLDGQDIAAVAAKLTPGQQATVERLVQENTPGTPRR